MIYLAGFMAQGSHFFGDMGGSMNFMNMTSLMGTGGGGSVGVMSFSSGAANNREASQMKIPAVTPREHNGISRPGFLEDSSFRAP